MGIDKISAYDFLTMPLSPVRCVLKGLIYQNLQNAAEGGMAPRPMVATAVLVGPRVVALRGRWSLHECVNMVCTVTPAVIPSSATDIGFLQVFTENSF